MESGAGGPFGPAVRSAPSGTLPVGRLVRSVCRAGTECGPRTLRQARPTWHGRGETLSEGGNASLSILVCNGDLRGLIPFGSEPVACFPSSDESEGRLLVLGLHAPPLRVRARQAHIEYGRLARRWGASRRHERRMSAPRHKTIREGVPGCRQVDQRPGRANPMGKWRELVREEILRLTRGQLGAEFTRQELLAQSLDRLEAKFPSARTPAQTLSRELQDLRSLGELEFVARGRYRLMVSPTQTPRAALETSRGPGQRPGAIQVATGQLRRRPFQFWIRSLVLPNFDHACAVCGLTPEWFLDAAHLRPASRFPELAGDPCAAIAVCKNHHQAMDHGALVIDEDLKLRVRLEGVHKKTSELERVLYRFEGARIRRPRRWALNRDALPSIPVRED